MSGLRSKVMRPLTITVAEFYDVFVQLWASSFVRTHKRQKIGTSLICSFLFSPSDIS